MTFFQAIFLAVVQGITEFLPVSSSGHLVLFQKIFGMVKPPVLFDVLLHFGTLLAILFFLKKEIFDLFKNFRKKKKLWAFLVVGSIPAAVFGYLLNSKVEQIFNSLFLVGVCWVIFGLILPISQFFRFQKAKLERKIEDVTTKDSLIIGLFQASALFPGISRSGSTIIGAFWRNFSKESAFKLSFLLSIPAILGAVVLELKDGHLDGVSSIEGLMAIVLSALVGYFSLVLLQKILKSNKFYYFGFYCLILGVFTLIMGW